MFRFLIALSVILTPTSCSKAGNGRISRAQALHATNNQLSLSPSETPTSSESPSPISPSSPPTNELNCQEMRDLAFEQYQGAQSECRACAELWQSCENCLNNINLDDLESELCYGICEAENNCNNDLLQNFTFPLREMNSEYISNGCMEEGENTIGGLPVYDPCSSPSPPPTDAPPPPSSSTTPMPTPQTSPMPSSH